VAPMIVGLLGDHECYAEVFCGGASVFWAKPREASRCEVLNDLDGELIAFYQVLHRSGRRLAREVDGMPYSRALFYRLRDGRPRSAFARARRFWYLNRVSFGAIRSGAAFGPKSTGRGLVLPASVLGDLDRTIERLRGVVFESVDAVRFLKLYDRPTTLFYLDPPYVDVSDGLYMVPFGEADHERLRAALAGLKGSWLLSYGDCPEIRRRYRGVPVRRFDMRYSIRSNTRQAKAGPEPKRGWELLISNRPFTPAPRGSRGS